MHELVDAAERAERAIDRGPDTFGRSEIAIDRGDAGRDRPTSLGHDRDSGAALREPRSHAEGEGM